jgi:hypothetical protein
MLIYVSLVSVILSLVVRETRVVSSTPRPFYPQGSQSPVPTEQEAA